MKKIMKNKEILMSMTMKKELEEKIIKLYATLFKMKILTKFLMEYLINIILF